jgi:hypothetical protein
MDRIRSRGEIPAYWNGITWPIEGVEFPDGCINADIVGRATQITVEHSDDGETWVAIGAAVKAVGPSPTGGPDPASPVVPDYAAARARGIYVDVPKPTATSPVELPPGTVTTVEAEREKTAPKRGRGRHKTT